MLSQFSQRDATNQSLTPLALRCKSLSLELIYESLKAGGEILQSKRIYEIVVREQLIPSLVKNSLSLDKQLFVLTLNIFVLLVWLMRDSLR